MNEMFKEVYGNLWEEYCRLTQLEIDLHHITGFTLEQLKELFLAGYMLESPDDANIDFRTLMNKLYY